MMLFRGRNPDITVWRRFRSGVDGFTFEKDGDHYEAYVGANAERVVDLFYTLSEHLPPAIDLVIEDKDLKITVGTQGFTTSELLSKTLRNDEFLYMHTVNHPQFLNFYAVQKIAWKLKARIRINFISSERQRITILVPVK